LMLLDVALCCHFMSDQAMPCLRELK